jgi:acyl-ACP thioesterase
MKDRKEDIIAVADSIWVYMDTENKCPAKVPKDNTGYILESPYPMEHMDRKISLPDNLVAYQPFPVIKANIDSYNHVNNGQYVKMAESFLPDDFYVTCMRVEYKMQALLGDIIHPKVTCINDKYYVSLDSNEGKPYAVIEFTGYRKD